MGGERRPTKVKKAGDCLGFKYTRKGISTKLVPVSITASSNHIVNFNPFFNMWYYYDQYYYHFIGHFVHLPLPKGTTASWDGKVSDDENNVRRTRHRCRDSC